MVRASALSTFLRRGAFALVALATAACGGHLSMIPEAVNQTVVLPANTTVQQQLQVLRIDAATATYSVGLGPTHGTLTLNAAFGTFLYTPAAAFTGTDAFTWSVVDKDGQSNVATVSIQVVAAVAAASPHAVGPATRLALADGQRDTRLLP